jgi:hypothetical protein
MDSVDTADSFDISKDKHKGQYALRKLYHESTRPITVLYTSPTCGPCRCVAGTCSAASSNLLVLSWLCRVEQGALCSLFTS